MAEYRDIEELLVWAFRDQQVEHCVSKLRGGAQGPSASLESGIGQILALGTRVDNTNVGARWLGVRCHDDALTLYEAVMALPADAWVEVIKHARTDSRPYWYPEGPGRWVTPRDKWGHPKLLYRDPVRKRDPIGEAPPELIGINPATVEDARAVYRLWHTALCELAGIVNREMTAFKARWPAVSPEPWIELMGAKSLAG